MIALAGFEAHFAEFSDGVARLSVRDEGPVSARAARRVSAREGREVRVPREPAAGVDPDVDDAHRTSAGRTARPGRPTRPATRPTE